MNSELLRRAATAYRGEIMQPYDVIMDMDGFDAICAFSDLMSGRTVYVPSKKTIFLHCIEREARREFDGGNYPILTRKYGLSERHLRKVFGGK